MPSVMTRVQTLLGLVAVLALGCPSTLVVDGITVRQDSWQEAEVEVTDQDKSDLGCEDITLKLMAVHPAASPTKIGAAGCGKNTIYVPGDNGWVQQPGN
jgi:hypothetical protein